MCLEAPGTRLTHPLSCSFSRRAVKMATAELSRAVAERLLRSPLLANVQTVNGWQRAGRASQGAWGAQSPGPKPGARPRRAGPSAASVAWRGARVRDSEVSHTRGRQLLRPPAQALPDLGSPPRAAHRQAPREQTLLRAQLGREAERSKVLKGLFSLPQVFKCSP